tara:strand:- start:1330 stop:1602 length:273 start_codon:yes stop_codon:yes gene_type:complete
MEEQSPLEEVVEPDNDLKNMLVEYVGEQNDPGDMLVTVEMVIDTLTEEFPEIVLALAEENWARGYHQALTDVEVGEKLYKEELEKQSNEG